MKPTYKNSIQGGDRVVAHRSLTCRCNGCKPDPSPFTATTLWTFNSIQQQYVEIRLENADKHTQHAPGTVHESGTAWAGGAIKSELRQVVTRMVGQGMRPKSIREQMTLDSENREGFVEKCFYSKGDVPEQHDIQEFSKMLTRVAKTVVNPANPSDIQVGSDLHILHKMVRLHPFSAFPDINISNASPNL